MTTYRTGNHRGVTIVREGNPRPPGDHWHEGLPCDICPSEDALVAVVVNGDRELAERICELLNADVEQNRDMRQSMNADGEL